MKEFFHIEGVTDRRKMFKEAEAMQLKGEPSVVHNHRLGRACNDDCSWFGPPCEPEE